MAQSGFDRRRINGPEESFPPIYGDDDIENSVWKLGMTRKGRNPNDIRPIFLQPGLITQANGSAYIETDKTKVACAIYGPRQSKNATYNENGRLNVEVKFAPYSCEQRKAPMRDAEDRSLAVAIHQALLPSVRLELLPKSTIDVFIVIIESDGIEGCIASGSVAASTALADAGIEMFGLAVACSAALVGEEIWLDPTAHEVQASTGSLILSTMPALGLVTSVWQNGQMRPEQVLKCLDLCQERCTEIHSIVAQALLDNVRLS
ncbi:mRNA transport regulator 3 [Guyanagaster necrorhizus]|uniref:mRNA transport regulator 3 n=1 Tax=Guyanagaster necrorhizus TaxID=856835 RepID=A0A9P8AYC0_9AGAR|nr:mRNA transport regulator 3 [Guyanagaster necrorhizus MCA 3950]KAG7452493.1 mRNA transport regulator 3 [Guyanagaster necrorhizus MCA 3950]